MTFIRQSSVAAALIISFVFGSSAEAQTIVTLATGLNGPNNIAVDRNDNIYFIDAGGNLDELLTTFETDLRRVITAIQNTQAGLG